VRALRTAGRSPKGPGFSRPERRLHYAEEPSEPHFGASGRGSGRCRDGPPQQSRTGPPLRRTIHGRPSRPDERKRVMAPPGAEADDWARRAAAFVPGDGARLHLLSTAVQFGTSVFEGIRAYDTPRGPAIFRLDAHVKRLLDSARIYRMIPEHSFETICDTCKAIVSKNGLKDCYIRPMILRGYGAPGLNPLNSPIETYVAAWAWGAYLGEGALSGGVDVCVSSWQRAIPNTFPARAKAG